MKKIKYLIALLFITTSLFAQSLGDNSYFKKDLWKRLTSTMIGLNSSGDYVTIPTPFTLGAISVTSTGTQINYLNGATGTTGTTTTNLVYSTSPTLVTPTLGVATATSLALSGNIILTKNTIGEENWVRFNKGTSSSWVGMLGSPEMNISFNMDYETGNHIVHDTTMNAWWWAMGDSEVKLQYAPKGFSNSPAVPGNDVWYRTGAQLKFRVDSAGVGEMKYLKLWHPNCGGAYYGNLTPSYLQIYSKDGAGDNDRYLQLGYGSGADSLKATLSEVISGGSAQGNLNFAGFSSYSFDKGITTGKNTGTSGQLNFVASDNDQSNIAVNTSDQMTFNGAAAYVYDAGITLGDVNPALSIGGSYFLAHVANEGQIMQLRNGSPFATAVLDGRTGAINRFRIANDAGKNRAIIDSSGRYTIYNRYTSTTNYSGLAIQTTSDSLFQISNLVLGGHTARPLQFVNFSSYTFDGAITSTSNISTWDSLTTRKEKSQLADSLGVITLATGVAGWGEVMAGDNQEWASFRFSSDGTVTLIANTANVTTTVNTVDKLNIYDAGTGVVIQNNLGASKKVAININYFIP